MKHRWTPRPVTRPTPNALAPDAMNDLAKLVSEYRKTLVAEGMGEADATQLAQAFQSEFLALIRQGVVAALGPQGVGSWK